MWHLSQGYWDRGGCLEAGGVGAQICLGMPGAQAWKTHSPH